MFRFQLLENEQLRQIYRQTEAMLFKPVLVVFVLIYFPWFFLLKYDLVSSYLRLLFFWTILVLIYALNKYLLWLVNVYLLTDRRLICVRYSNLFSKHVTETPLDKILNIGYGTRGFWATLMKFGTVEVKVPGLSEPMELANVSHPSQIKDLLWHAHAQTSVAHPVASTSQEIRIPRSKFGNSAHHHI